MELEDPEDPGQFYNARITKLEHAGPADQTIELVWLTSGHPSGVVTIPKISLNLKQAPHGPRRSNWKLNSKISMREDAICDGGITGAAGGEGEVDDDNGAGGRDEGGQAGEAQWYDAKITGFDAESTVLQVTWAEPDSGTVTLPLNSHHMRALRYMPTDE